MRHLLMAVLGLLVAVTGANAAASQEVVNFTLDNGLEVTSLLTGALLSD